MTTNAKSYFEMAQEREQELELDATADGHSALALQAKRITSRGPKLPQQPPHSPWAADHVPPEPPLGYSINQVVDVSKVER
jgi:hypothetical protein